MKQFQLSDADSMRPLGVIGLRKEGFGIVPARTRSLFPPLRLGIFERISGELPLPFVVVGLFTKPPISQLAVGIDSKAASGFPTLQSAEAEFVRLSTVVGAPSGSSLYWVFVQPIN